MNHVPWILSSSPRAEGEIEIEVESLPLPENFIPPDGLAVESIESETEEWVEFRWTSPIPEGDSDLTFEADLSDDSGFRWSLLPYLTYYEDRSKTSFRIPRSLFPDGTPLYFRVRRIHEMGLVSDWSPTLKFRL